MSVLFLKQIRVGSCARCRQYKLIVVNNINKQPVRRNMAFTEFRESSGQLMIPMLDFQWFS